MKTILFSTLAILSFVLSFNSHYQTKQNHLVQKYSSQSYYNDTIKVKLTQKLKSSTDNTDRQIIQQLINLNDSISNIKTDYSNTDIKTLQYYKKRLVENVPYYKKLNVMKEFVFNLKKVKNYISDLELEILKSETAKARLDSEEARKKMLLAKLQSDKSIKFKQASQEYQRLLKKENITKNDIDNFKITYPKYSNEKPKGKKKTWLELLLELTN